MHNNVNTLTLTAKSLPLEVTSISGAPKQLYCKGIPIVGMMQLPRVAIVGSRRVDSYGTVVTKKLAGELAAKGIVIISGLALGVDTLAHTAALESRGLTIAVLPSGIEKIYPASNGRLGMRIVEHGTVVSETKGVYQPYEFDFLKRNRLISALSQVVIITQAASRSGSLNTAKHALEQGRIVMAVPGPINNPLCEGTNNLLKMGAYPVTCAEDVLRQLGLKDTMTQLNLDLVAQNKEEQAIIHALKLSSMSLEQLVSHTSLPSTICLSTLSVLEIEGIITVSGNIWSLA